MLLVAFKEVEHEYSIEGQPWKSFLPLLSFLLLSHRSRSQVTGCSSGHDTGCSATICRSYRSQMGYTILILRAFNYSYMTCAVT